MVFKVPVVRRAWLTAETRRSSKLSHSPSTMSSASSFTYSYAEDKSFYTSLSDIKDEPRHSDIPDDGPALLLMNYDIVFVVSCSKFTSTKPLIAPFHFEQVDDSTSMKRGRPISRWQECRDAISEIAEEAVKYDTDGVEVNFLNNKATKTCRVGILLHCSRDWATHFHWQTKYEVEKLFDSVKVSGRDICCRVGCRS